MENVCDASVDKLDSIEVYQLRRSDVNCELGERIQLVRYWAGVSFFYA